MHAFYNYHVVLYCDRRMSFEKKTETCLSTGGSGWHGVRVGCHIRTRGIVDPSTSIMAKKAKKGDLSVMFMKDLMTSVYYPLFLFSLFTVV